MDQTFLSSVSGTQSGVSAMSRTAQASSAERHEEAEAGCPQDPGSGFQRLSQALDASSECMAVGSQVEYKGTPTVLRARDRAGLLRQGQRFLLGGAARALERRGDDQGQPW